MKAKPTLAVAAALLAALIHASGAAAAEEDKTADRLLRAAEGLQMPSSEADSSWSVLSFAGTEEPPVAARFGEMSGCPEGGTSRLDFEYTLERLGTVEPWMDDGQASSARGFRKLEGVFERKFGKKVAVYRCDPGGPEVNVYFVGADEGALVALETVSIET